MTARLAEEVLEPGQEPVESLLELLQLLEQRKGFLSADGRYQGVSMMAERRRLSSS